ncbi:hypothetical protein GCM10027447_17240 [Glycomyces halotolerans]
MALMPPEESPEPGSSRPREALQRVKRSPELPTPGPVPVRMTPVAAAGTLLWTIGFALTQLFRDQLADSGREWWAACALTGVALGLIGTAAMAVRDRRRFSSGGHKTSEPSSS